MNGQRAKGWYRDTVLFFAGLGLIGYEALLYDGEPRWGLLMIYAGMVGLPAFIRADQKLNGKEPESKEPEHDTA